MKAREIMSRDVKTVREDTHLRDVAEFLMDNQVSGVPVVDSKGRLVGMISEADLMDSRKRSAVIPPLALFGLSIVPERMLRAAYEEGFSLRARDLMSSHVVTADEDTSVEDLADLMLRKHVNRVPIIRRGEVIGIVTREDVLRGLRGIGR